MVVGASNQPTVPGKCDANGNPDTSQADAALLGAGNNPNKPTDDAGDGSAAKAAAAAAAAAEAQKKKEQTLKVAAAATLGVGVVAIIAKLAVSH